MKVLKTWTVIMLFGLFIGQAMFAQESVMTGSIQGQIIDAETKLPLAGANIVLLNTKRGAASNGEGNFLIQTISAGSYSLRITYLGYETVTRTDVIVRPNRITFMNEELKVSALQAEAVVVSAGYFRESQDQPVSHTSFKAEEIRRAPGSAGDVSRILYGLPGVAKVNDTKNSLIVRGGSAIENGFYLDNIEINNINHFPEQGSSGGPIGMLNVDFIQDVHFYSGGFSSTYGDRMSSVMELQMREGNRETLDMQLDLNFGGFGAQAEGPAFDKKGSWAVSIRRSYLDMILGAIDESETAIPQYGDFQAKVVYDLSPTQKLTLLNVGALDYISHSRESAIDEKNNMYLDFELLQNTIGLNLRSLWGERGYSNTSLSHNVLDYNFTMFDTWDFIESGQEKMLTDQNSGEIGIRLRNVNYFKLNSKNKIEFGIEAKYIQMDYHNHFGEYTDFLGNTTPSMVFKKGESAVKYFGFASWQWQPVSGLILNPGIRTGYFTYNENVTVSPRFSASMQLSARTALHFAAGVYHQNLPLILLAQNESFKDLQDPEAHHLIAGVTHLLNENTQLTVEVYNKEYWNFPIDPAQEELFLMDEVSNTSLFLPHESLTDQGKGRSRGVEVMIQKKLARNLYGMVSGSCFRAEYQNTDHVWRNRTVDNQVTFNIEGGYKPNNKWEFSLRWIYAGGRPYTPFDAAASEAAHQGLYNENRINGDRLPDYHSLNVRFDRRFFFSHSNLVLYLSVWNAYGRRNISEYTWNEIDNMQKSSEQWGTLPIFGLEYEF